jgi:hypothetical protein
MPIFDIKAGYINELRWSDPWPGFGRAPALDQQRTLTLIGAPVVRRGHVAHG